MDSISINALLPNGVKIKKITTGSELLLAYELDKYARIYLDKSVTLKDVSIAKQLHKSNEFAFVVSMGLDLGFEVVNSKDTLANIQSKMYFFFTGTVEGADIKKTDDLWTYNFSSNISKNGILYGANRSAAYISLIAYMFITSYMSKKKCPKLLIDHEKHAQLELEYVDLLILKNFGNRLLKDLLEIKFNPAVKTQPEWEAFVTVNRQRGFMIREYTPAEKSKYFKKSFEVGDVVLLYERAKSSKSKTIKRLVSCYPAVITGFNGNEISFTYYPSVSTRLTHSMDLSVLLDKLEFECDTDKEKEKLAALFSEKDFNNFTVCNCKYSLGDIGVAELTYTELRFFIRPIDFDGSMQWFKTEDGFKQIWCSTPDTIYAMFEDRGIKYNKEKFVDTYFTQRKRTPIYEKYRKYMDDEDVKNA